MGRATYAKPRHWRKLRLFQRVKGYRLGRSKLYRVASEALVRAGVYAYAHRRQKKRNFRALWITRLTAACRMRGMQYSRFIAGLKAADVILNRKMMSEVAIHDPAAFDQLVEIARKHLVVRKVA